MPEIKNTFLKGRMNKDLDERLVPKGEYRDALNVEIATSEDSDIGTVKNILGNKRIESAIPEGYTCVASIANEKTNKLYWFISKYNVDAIVEYDHTNDITNYVLVDTKAGTAGAVLKFFGNAITGINIIDNLLFWTDNRGEPKKINIDTCKAGTAVANSSNFPTHTQLLFDNGSFHGITLDLIADDSYHPIYATEGRYAWFDESQILKLFYPFGPNTGFINPFVFSASKYADFDAYLIRHYRNNEFLGTKRVKVWNGKTNSNNGSHLRVGPDYGDSTDKDFRVGDVIFGNNIGVDIEESHVTVIKTKPLNAFSVKVNHLEGSLNTNKIPNLFETTFPRFSYRYKFRDGEYSAFAPFTQPVFNAKYPKDTSKSTDGSISYTRDNVYDIKEPYNKAMTNSIHSIDLGDFITAHTPEDVEEIEVLYKKEDSSVIYSIATIKNYDEEWHSSSDYEGLGNSIGIGKSLVPADDGQYQAIGGQTKGRYKVTTENIYAALPANQLLRPWDNVPRKALAQEVTGNRVVYGNYLQNYEIPLNPKVYLGYEDRKNPLSSFEFKGLPSIKSQRNYQLGVVLTDKYGRETPVFTSQEGAANVSWQDASGNTNASKSNQLVASVDNNFPEWVDSLRFFVKQTSNEYYNLTMQRAWVTKSTYELDNSEGHLWISFPSSDRNKVSEEDYIILKKKIEPNASQIDFENKFKVIDIKNEAPDSIKYRLVNYGTISNSGSQTGGVTNLFPNYSQSIEFYDTSALKGTDTLILDVSEWESQLGAGFEQFISGSLGDDSLNVKDFYVSWSRVGTDNAASKKYKVVAGSLQSAGTGSYLLKLSTHISKVDADIAHCFGESSQTTAGSSSAQLDPANGLHQDLVFQLQKKELIDSEDFSGSFFVKISKNQVSSIIETGNEVSNLEKYQVKAKNSVYYLLDKVGTAAIVDLTGGTYGLTNYNGDPGTQSSSNSHLDTGADFDQVNQNPTSTTESKLSDHSSVWVGVLKAMSDHGISGLNRFFVDATHMASGQSDASDYAKYGCVTWSGATAGALTSPENSCWSYPPLKTWITDFKEKESDIAFLPDSIFYQNELISQNIIGATADPDYNDLKVDGWVGPLQNVSREKPESSFITVNHVNGLEGIVTTEEDHTIGPRRWFSGMNGTDNGVGQDTKTYANNTEEERHFMHLSFFAPGKNLHNNIWDNLLTDDTGVVYGPQSFAANLQGIWGGGVFTGKTKGERFGNEADKWKHFPMEGNHDANENYLPETPGPGVGQGYNLKYKEAHDRQWDPTFLHDKGDIFVGDPENRIRDFIRNLYPGSKFRFNRTETPTSSLVPTIDTEVYTIKKVVVKKLYNHTSWRRAYNRYFGSPNFYNQPDSGINVAYKSVEQTALGYLNTLNDDGTNGSATQLKNKIVQFGGKHNRRLCYIIELDKNPTNSPASFGNPLTRANSMNGDIDSDNYTDIEFLDPIQDLLLSDLSKFPAIWELSPKKQQTDLDIYYEASNSIPVNINEQTNELFAPVGCKVEVLNAPSQENLNEVYLESWDSNIAIFNPGLQAHDGSNEIDYTNASFKFIRQDGSYTIAEAGGQQLIGASASSEANYLKKDFIFKKQIGSKIKAGLSWYNCFSFGNGLESNRINDDFNEVFISNGVKASTTTQQPYKEERRKSGLIYSGIYNSNSGVNDLNQFIMAEKITKDLNPTYGSIQKLFQRRISLVAFCEDRVIQITSNKDALFNADGDSQLISTNAVLGDATPFVGEYGISNNPESFASESYRAYFTDKQRGAVLRLSKDGITPVSSSGMHDWFRDNLKKHPALIGTYDAYKNNYNVTLTGAHAENLIFNSEFNEGAVSVPQSNLNLNLIENGKVFNHTNVGQYDVSLNNYSFPTQATFTLGSNEEKFKDTITVINHPAIPEGMFQLAYNSTAPTANFAVATTTGTGIQYVQPQYDVAANLEDDGWFYDPRFTSSTNQSKKMFGVFSTSVSQMEHDAQISSNIKRTTSGVLNDEYTTPPQSSPIDNPNSISGTTVTSNSLNNWYSGHDPLEKKPIVYPNPDSYTYQHKISRCVTRNENTGAIAFDRANPSDSYVEFDNFGGFYIEYPSYGVNNDYAASTNSGTPITSDLKHRHFFNGDELHVQVELLCYPTMNVATNTTFQETAGHYGYNYIKPKIELFCDDPDGSGNRIPVPNDMLIDSQDWSVAYDPNSSDPFAKRHSKPDDLGGDFVDENTVFAYENYTGNKYKYISTHTSPAGGGAKYQFTFPLTNSIAPLKYTGSNYSANATPVEVTVGCSFKFKDPAQQYDDGIPMDPASIQEAMIVKNLSIRISNAEPAYGSNATAYNSTNSFLAAYNSSDNEYYDAAMGNWNGVYRGINQLWEIKKIFTKKGYGITAPYEPEIAEITLYDDPNNGNNNGLTLAQLQSLYPGQVALVGGSYAVNGTAVNSYVAVNEVAIPSSTIPAWVQVQYGSSLDWNFGVNNGFGGWGAGNAGKYATVKNFNWFGHEAPAADQPYTLANNTTGSYKIKDVSSPPNNGYQGYPFDKKNDNDFSSTANTYNGDPTLESNNFTLPALFETPSTNVVGNAVVSPQSYTYTDVVNHYWRIKHDGNGGSYPLSANLGGGNQYNAGGSWYLIDIEYLNANSSIDVFDSATIPSTGSYDIPSNGVGGPGDGNVHVPGVCDHNTITTTNIVVNKYGLGISKGSSTSMGIKLLPVFRTEYSDDRWVLRAIFQVDSASDINNSPTHLEYLNLMFNGFTNNEILVAKVISKDISVFNNTGGAADWDKPSVYDKKHTFTDGYYVTDDLNKYSNPTSKANMYYYANTLSWDNVPKFDTDGSTEISRYKQDFSLAPTGTQEFTFNFSIGENTFVTPSVFSGELSVMIKASDIDGNGAQATLNVTGIDAVGDYEIVFKLGDSSPTLTLDPSGGNVTMAVGNNANGVDEIYFYNNDASNNVSASVSGIELADSTEIFVGASVGSWNFDGFEPTIDEHIVWDSSGRIQFSNAPLFDATFAGVNPVMISQPIETPINRHEKYKVEFTYKIVANNDIGGDGELHMYYFNSQGYGFRIKNIGSGSGYNVAETITVNGVSGISRVEEIVTIEELASTEVTETYGSGVEALRNTIVVRKENENNSSSRVTAWIDGISITQMFNYPPEADYEKTTITFSEKTNGWTSFKSFIPENGVSLSNQYFTFNNAKLYRHYVPMLDGVTGVTTEEANNYNIFYGETNSKSFIKTVLNAEPSVIKTFNTLNYEGSQAYITKPSSALDQFGNNAITINNQKAWSLGTDVQGWNVTEIKTDLDNGDLKNFVKKEGKWFGYIKGQTGGVLNTSMFSVLGIGTIKAVENAGNISPNLNVPPLSVPSANNNIFTIDATVDNTDNSTNNNIFTTIPPSNNNTGGGGGGGSY